MSQLEENVTSDHLKLMESINRRVDTIYNQLREYEECLETENFDNTEDSQVKIMDLLENLETIQEAAQLLRPYNLELRCRKQALEEQMKCLEQSVDLLKLECGDAAKK